MKKWIELPDALININSIYVIKKYEIVNKENTDHPYYIKIFCAGIEGACGLGFKSEEERDFGYDELREMVLGK